MNTKRITDVAGLNFLWQVDNLYLAGQPAVESYEHIKELGVKKIINLRDNSEKDFSEDLAKINELEMEYVQFPIIVDAKLSSENCKKLGDMLESENNHFIHCGSANRVGGWLITYLVLYRAMDFDSAVEIAYKSGLSSHALVDQAQEVIDQLKG